MMRFWEQSIYRLRRQPAEKPKPIYYYYVLLNIKRKNCDRLLTYLIYQANNKFFT
ncbi:hypothetical protein NOS3756_23100 [Nostoc sp. NIES-3756]|uniref:hypothetical protein n=1 Tax=Nostoc sp. NIES-3756 TaxID=1751286 RepID=UPI00072151C9|nr:hypothetical protein [Nostoc sp. NIES-3756]BAT53350.1 hypothetical protein NOS3756_23100 [Nostoc sp. NIES-3756]BAY38917.1 hypothetical protein NIES2111_32660 [Nostoc sp. NIES-2111]